MDVQVPNGTVDIAVKDEAEAVDARARQYLSYFQGAVSSWTAPDQRILRTIIPENRLRMYDIRKVIETLADTDSFLEISPDFGLGMVTELYPPRRPSGRSACEQPVAPRPVQSIAMVRTKRPASCSYATPSTSRSWSFATLRG